ncbi:MAG: hypothetical protein ACPL6C_02120, partial [bacterium]
AYICISAFDIAKYCGGNNKDSCFVYYIESSGPIVLPVFPRNGSTMSCNDTTLIIALYDRNGLDENSIRVIFDADTIIYGDPRLSYNSGYLYLSLRGVGEGYHLFVLLNAADRFGNTIESEFEINFFIDRTPPIFISPSPENGDTVSTRSPTFTIEIYDSGGGLAMQPFLFTADIRGNRYRYTISDSLMLNYSNNLMIFDFQRAGIILNGGDTVRIGIIAYDSIDYCSSNMNDTTITFFIEHSPPQVELISPRIGNYTSCEYESIRFRIIDDDGIDTGSIRLIVNGTEFRYGMRELRIVGDTLTFAPLTRWIDGMRVYFSISELRDMLGNDLVEPFSGYFYIDRSPPYVSGFFPPQNYISPDTFQNISIFVQDNLSGVDSTSILLSINGELYGWGDSSITYRSGVITYSPRNSGRSFNSVGPVEVQLISISDRAQNCGANTMDSILFFSFYIDSRTPVIYPSENVFSGCDNQGGWIYLWSPIGIIEDSILLEVNGEVYDIDAPEMDFRNDTLYFTPRVDWNDCDTVFMRLLRATDGVRRFDTLSWGFMIDKLPPEIQILTPSCGSELSVLNPRVVAVINDECSGVNWSSFSLNINDNMLYVGNPSITILQDTLSFNILDILPDIRGGSEIDLRMDFSIFL